MTQTRRKRNIDDGASAQADIVADLRTKLSLRADVVKELEATLKPKVPRIPMNSSWPAVLAVPLFLYAEATGTTPNRILQQLVIDHLPINVNPNARTSRRREPTSSKTP